MIQIIQITIEMFKMVKSLDYEIDIESLVLVINQTK